MKTAIALCAALALTGSARAANIVVNGGFESGLTGWITSSQVGSDGQFFAQSGSASPVNGLPVPAPAEGSFAAMTDALGPGTHVLYQDIFIPSAVPVALFSFSLFIGNRAADFSAPDSLDFSTPTLNQQARVDVLRASADPFSVDPADVLMTLYRTMPGDPLVSGYSTITRNITSLVQANAGQTLRLRIAEVDNVNFFNLGLDNVVLDTNPVPEPSSAGLAVLGLAFGAWLRRRLR